MSRNKKIMSKLQKLGHRAKIVLEVILTLTG